VFTLPNFVPRPCSPFTDAVEKIHRVSVTVAKGVAQWRLD